MMGSLAFPLLVPLLMLRYNLAVGLIGAVLIGTLWFVAMLRSSEMPGHS
jgi:peptidoglycan/LPS O-acetylase OafA/YrhL